MSIRFRFTLLYTFIFALTLTVFGFALYTIQAQDTLTSLKQDLSLGANKLAEATLKNGLLHYVYPLDVTHIMSRRAIDSVSISLQVESDDPIGSIYSPSHNIALSRDGNGFRAGFEASNYVPEGDYSLYWGVASETISVNLLTYRESANVDGFFMLMVQPPLELPQDRIVPRDIIVVLDQSGSMDGDKWNQAREAAAYVLDNLNEQDRFNVILFSTGWRSFANDLQSPDVAQQAIDWINTDQPGFGAKPPRKHREEVGLVAQLSFVSRHH